MEDNNEYKPNLIPCPKCGHQISTRAEKCPHCGYVMTESTRVTNISSSDIQLDKESAPQTPPLSINLDKGAATYGNATSNSGPSRPSAPEVPPVNVKTNNTSTTKSNPSPTSKIQQSTSNSSGNKSTSKINDTESQVHVQVVPTHSHNRKAVIGLIIVLSVIIIGITLIFCYKNIFLPNKIDREAPRYYSYVPSLILRSSQSSGADYNKISSLPYGTELILYDKGAEWSSIKVNEENADGDKLKGYVSSMYILDKHDFALLNSIFGDVESKEVISTAKCRLALLNYFKENKYIGKISDQERINAGIEISPNTVNQWQVYSKGKNQKTNTTYFKRLYNKESKFTDFAVIIENVNIENRKLLYFYFDDDETPHLLYSEDVPFGYKYIKKIKINDNYGSQSIKVEYIR